MCVCPGLTFNSGTSPSLRDAIPDYKVTPLPGFTVGVSKNIIFNKKHHCQLGLSYVNTRHLSESESFQSSALVSSNYIEIPFYRISSINKLNFEYGLYAAFLLWRNYTEDDLTSRDENAMIYDFGLRGGLGYEFEHFTIKTVFVFGLVNENNSYGSLYKASRTLSVLLAIPIMRN